MELLQSMNTRFIYGRMFVELLCLSFLVLQGAEAGRNKFCKKTNKIVYKACKEQAAGDFLIEIAKAEYLPSREEQREAIGQAREDFREELGLSKAQLIARNDLCQLLNETIYHPNLDPAEYEDGFIVSTHGAWIAGDDGAKPGIIMQASPQIGQVYRQEFAVGEAEDVAAVISLSESVAVPFGSYTDCLQTEDYTPIDPDVLEFKYYALGMGVVKEINPDTGEELVLVDAFTE